MIDRIIEQSIKNRAVVILAGILLAIAGIYAVYTVPIDAIPDLSDDQVLVTATWPSHAPGEIEEQLTYPVSLALQGLHGAKAIRTSSDFSEATLFIILEEGTDVAATRRQIAQRLAEVALPTGATVKLGPDAAATGQIFWYTIEGPGAELGRLRAIQDWIVKPRIAAVPGVAEVAGVGGFPIEFGVAIHPEKMTAAGITISQVLSAIEQSNKIAGGGSIQKGNAEYLVREFGTLGAASGSSDESILRDLENIPLQSRVGKPLRLSDIASVAVVPGPRRGVLEKDGKEAVGGVVMMTRGENPREVTRRINQQILELTDSLPKGVRIVPFYDRTPLIDGAISTVTGTVIEAIITASICVFLILLHIRTSFVIAITLPLAALGSFALMGLLRVLHLADVQTNIMSLAGIAISIGILVDSSIVMAENVMHRLREHFGDTPARGDLRAIVLPACQAVGRPIFFSVVIMILSFLPVFALSGMEGKMFRPLAMTKTFALITVAILAITAVPALCTMFVRGRLRREEDSPIVRSVIEIYRPTLRYLIDHPAAITWIMAATLVVGLAPIGNRSLFLATLFTGLVGLGLVSRRPLGAALSMASLMLIGLSAERWMTPLTREFLSPLDEGMAMDMPITVPRASVTQSGSDLFARDMILCRFPEVDMVVGKAGRADTPTDPAPLDMIETMVNFRPRTFWPKRKLTERDASKMTAKVLDALLEAKIVTPPKDRSAAINATVQEILPLFDTQLREYAYQRNLTFLKDHSATFAHAGHQAATPEQTALWKTHLGYVNAELITRAADAVARLSLEDLILSLGATDPSVTQTLQTIRDLRSREPVHSHGGSHHHDAIIAPKLPPLPQLESLQTKLAADFANSIVLWKKDRAELIGFGSEPDRLLNMPGWSNIWTMPIQNRVDMLATGVNTTVGVRVLGQNLDSVVSASDQIASAIKKLPGATDVVADPIRGKGYLDIKPDRLAAAKLSVNPGEIARTIETALGGTIATTVVQGRERHPVRVRFARDARQDEESVKALPVPNLAQGFVRLERVAEVQITEGPATIKGEAGTLRNYVRLNVRNRSASEFVDEARQVVSQLMLPDGVRVEWTGQFEHELHARKTLLIVLPIVILLILGVLYWTYRDIADALMMLLAVPGAIAGGVFFQWLLGYPFSVTVWVGYIACFGMATSTGIIMLVYLREAIERAGGLHSLNEQTLKQAVLQGAVHRLRPKLLTEGTTILGLAPMFWADGPGAEVIRPMAAPVLGGLLIADEVIDLFLPVLFFHIRRRRLQSTETPTDSTTHSELVETAPTIAAN